MVLLHAANLRHGANGITSLPKEGMLRIFLPEKFQWLRLGANPKFGVPEASMLTTRPPTRLNLGGVEPSSQKYNKYRLPHIYILPPDDGLFMPETCRCIVIQ
jgi:hypothetical protein